MNGRARPALDWYAVSLAVLVGVAAVGIVMLVVAAARSADAGVVAGQVPYLVSGGVGGLALAATALGVLSMQLRRQEEARQRDELERVLDAAWELLEAARRRQ